MAVVLEQDFYELLTLRLLVRSEHRELARALRWHLEDFRRPALEECDVVVEVLSSPDGKLSYFRDGLEERSGSPTGILRHALWDIHGLVPFRASGFLFLHAGAVVRNGVALLMPAAMGEGKSTLTAALIQRGHAYLSDELGVLNVASGMAYPFQRRIALHPKALGYLPGLEERLRDRKGISIELPDRYAGAADLGGSIGQPARVGRVVFLGPDREGDARLIPMTRAEATVELARYCFNLFRYGQKGVTLLARVAAGGESYTLQGGTIRERANLIAGLHA